MLSRPLLMRIAIVWTVAIVVISFLPLKIKEAIGTETDSPIPAVQHQTAIKHRVGHLIAFGVASLLFTTASIKKTHRLNYFLLSAALGSIIEYMQHAIFGSVFEWWDIRDDVFAAAAGYLLGSLLAFCIPSSKG